MLALSLLGHGDNYSRAEGMDEERARLESFKKVSYGVWMREAYLAYLQVKARGQDRGVPLFLTAYSLGALIGLDLFASNADVAFDKLILFAPAIRLRGVIYLERVFAPFPRLVIPSPSPADYLANARGTTVAAYNALLDGLEHFDRHAAKKLDVPTLVFLDPKDEFIPLKKLKKLAAERDWTQWRFYTVQKDEAAREASFHHHIIDASTTGEKAWQEMMAATITYLNE